MREVTLYLNLKELPRPGGFDNQHEDFLQALSLYWQVDAEENPPPQA